MDKKNISILIIVLVLLCLVGVYCYFFYGKVNYLIPGVPYNGIYNLFYQRANTSEISSVLDVLGYWGDKRFPVMDLKQKFPPERLSTSTQMLSAAWKSEIQNIFTENGYETSGWLSAKSADAIKKIKQYVNSGKRVPVIVFEKRVLDQKNNVFIFAPQVVIGIFENSQKIIIHDHYYGNNYEVSFSDFTKIFQETGAGILAVWPSDGIRGVIDGPNYNSIYPKRLESMDKAGTLLAIKDPLVLTLWWKGFREQSIAVWEEYVNDINFKYLPTPFQVSRLTKLAGFYILLNKPDEVIKIINERVIPINKELSKASQGWFGTIPDEFSSPYQVLSDAYLRKGQHDLAIDSYKKMKAISDSIQEKVGEDNYLSPPLIEELEKEISSQ